MADDFDERLIASNADFDVEWERFLREDWPELVAQTDAMVAALLANRLFYRAPIEFLHRNCRRMIAIWVND